MNFKTKILKKIISIFVASTVAMSCAATSVGAIKGGRKTKKTSSVQSNSRLEKKKEKRSVDISTLQENLNEDEKENIQNQNDDKLENKNNSNEYSSTTKELTKAIKNSSEPNHNLGDYGQRSEESCLERGGNEYNENLLGTNLDFSANRWVEDLKIFECSKIDEYNELSSENDIKSKSLYCLYDDKSIEKYPYQNQINDENIDQYYEIEKDISQNQINDGNIDQYYEIEKDISQNQINDENIDQNNETKKDISQNQINDNQHNDQFFNQKIYRYNLKNPKKFMPRGHKNLKLMCIHCGEKVNIKLAGYRTRGNKEAVQQYKCGHCNRKFTNNDQRTKNIIFNDIEKSTILKNHRKRNYCIENAMLNTAIKRVLAEKKAINYYSKGNKKNELKEWNESGIMFDGFNFSKRQLMEKIFSDKILYPSESEIIDISNNQWDIVKNIILKKGLDKILEIKKGRTKKEDEHPNITYIANKLKNLSSDTLKLYVRICAFCQATINRNCNLNPEEGLYENIANIKNKHVEVFTSIKKRNEKKLIDESLKDSLDTLCEENKVIKNSTCYWDLLTNILKTKKKQSDLYSTGIFEKVNYSEKKQLQLDLETLEVCCSVAKAKEKLKNMQNLLTDKKIEKVYDEKEKNKKGTKSKEK